MKAIHLTKAAAVAVSSLAMVAAGSSLATADESGPATSQSSISSSDGQTTAKGQPAPEAQGARKSQRAAVTVPNIKKIRLQNYVVSSRGKKYLGGSAKITHPGNFYKGYARVFRGKKRIGTAKVYASGNVYFTYHPKQDGRGKIRVGATKVFRYHGGKYWDHTRGTSHFKAAIKGGLRIKANGRKHVFKSRTKYWSTSKGKWEGYHHRAYLKHKVHGHWRTFKKIKLNKEGKDKYVKYVSKNRKYRLRLKSTTKVVGGKTTPSRRI